MDIQFYFSLHAHNEALVIMIFQCISSLNYFVISIIMIHCVKNVRIRSYSGPHFFAFGLNTERYSASLPHFPAFGLNTERYSASLPHFFAFGLNTERYSASLPHFPAFGLNTEVRMRENANQNNSECEHFLRSDYLH